MFSPSETLAPTPVNVAPPLETVVLSPVSLAPPPVPSAPPLGSLTSPPVLPTALPPVDPAQPPVIAAVPTVMATGPPDLHATPPSPPLAPHPVQYPSLPPPLQSALSSVPWPSTFAPWNYNPASMPYSDHPAQYHLSRSAFNYPVQATMCSTSALPPSSPQQPQATDMSPFIATSYGIPKPMIPCFESGKENDFALLKVALDNLLNSHLHLNEQYKYQVLLGHLKLPSVLQLAKAYMHDLRPYTTACRLYRTSMASLVSLFKAS